MVFINAEYSRLKFTIRVNPKQHHSTYLAIFGVEKHPFSLRMTTLNEETQQVEFVFTEHKGRHIPRPATPILDPISQFIFTDSLGQTRHWYPVPRAHWGVTWYHRPMYAA